MEEIMNTELGMLIFTDDGSDYILYPSQDFLESVLYRYASSNKALITACENAHLEHEPILFREKNEYGGNMSAAYIDFANIVRSEFGVNVFES